MIRNITPGIPKNPAISAVIALIPILNEKYFPIKFTMTSSTTPSTAFIISLNKIFKGQENTFTNT